MEKLERLQFEAARIITGLPRFASRESLLFETGWETLSRRRYRRKLNLFYKIHTGKAPEYLTDCLNENGAVVNYNIRNPQQYRIPRCRPETFSKSFFPSVIRSWNSLPQNQRDLPSYYTFKLSLKGENYVVPQYYLIGNREDNIIHTKLRHRCSSLNADLYRVNLSNDPSCACGCPLEDAIHFLLEYPLFLNARVKYLVPLSRILTLDIETLLFGSTTSSIEFNTNLFRNVHDYIRHTKRFATQPTN